MPDKSQAADMESRPKALVSKSVCDAGLSMMKVFNLCVWRKIASPSPAVFHCEQEDANGLTPRRFGPDAFWSQLN